MRPTIEVVRRGENYFTADFSHTGHVHRAEGKSREEVVGRLVCEHTDLLQLPVTVRDLATNPRAEAVELQPSCWCGE